MTISAEQMPPESRPDPAAPAQISDEAIVTSVARVVGGFLYRYSTEIDLQDRMHEVLAEVGYSVERERRLDARNRTDLWLDGIVVEVKVGGSLSAALRQVSRYMNLPEVRGIVLASTERWASQPLSNQPEWGGKPFAMIRVRRQSL